MKKIIVLLVVFTMFAGLSYSEEKEKLLFRAGISAKLKESLYVDADSELSVLPCLQVKYKMVNFDGDRINIDLFQKNSFNFRIVSKINYDGYKGEDSDYLKGMKDRKGGLLGGAELEYLNLKNGQNITMAVNSDITNKSNGITASIEAGQFIPLGKKIFLKPSIGVKYMNADYADYYYGVKDEERISGRAAYKVGDEFALKFKGLVIYKVTERVNIIGLYELEKVSDDIKESPVVEKGSAGTAILMASYRF